MPCASTTWGMIGIKPFASGTLFLSGGQPDSPTKAEDDQRARMALRSRPFVRRADRGHPRADDGGPGQERRAGGAGAARVRLGRGRAV